MPNPLETNPIAGFLDTGEITNAETLVYGKRSGRDLPNAIIIVGRRGVCYRYLGSHQVPGIR